MNIEGALPIAETFYSIQGEGQYTGTPMFFVRLAGCNVGRPSHAVKVGPFPMLPTGREAVACTSWDGRTFPCDTDYTRSETLPCEEILFKVQETGLKHVLLTGGEPFIHAARLDRLVGLLNKSGLHVHIETSGTIFPQSARTRYLYPDTWITCAPKVGALSRMIMRADEVKLLVDEEFNLEKLTPPMVEHRNVWLCPINGVNDVTRTNAERCKELLRTHPTWHMSVQMHKFFNWR